MLGTIPTLGNPAGGVNTPVDGGVTRVGAPNRFPVLVPLAPDDANGLSDGIADDGTGVNAEPLPGSKVLPPPGVTACRHPPVIVTIATNNVVKPTG